MEEERLTSVGIYVRVSTEEQAKEGYSVRAQIEKLSDYARIMGWSVYKVYADDGISGKNIVDRPAINEMIKDIISSKVNTVLVFKVDRLTRNTKDLIELVELFNKHDCNFSSLMESIDTKTASGRMFLKIIGIFAEFERENIVERVKLGMERKAREGYTLASYTPSFGYDREVGEKIQTINEEEAKIVQEIFDMYTIENKAMNNIAQQLNIRGLQTKMGCVWNGKTVKNILQNVNYVGKIRYSINDKSRYFETEGHHESIISEEQFEQASRKLAKIEKKIKTKRPKEGNFFVGSLYCGICGRPLATHGIYKTRKDGTKHYMGQYRCVNKMLKACTAKDVSHKKIEQAFLEYIDNIEDLDVINDIELENNVKQNNDDIILAEHKKKLSQLEIKESEIMKLYIGGKFDFDEYTKMTTIIKKEITKYKENIELLEKSTVGETETINQEDIITNIRENWSYLTNSEKMDFVTNFIEKIVVINEQQKDTHHGNVKIKELKFYSE